MEGQGDLSATLRRHGSPWFTSCEMPDLSDLEASPTYLERILRALFHGTSPRAGGALSLTIGLETSLDQAVVDYQAARSEVGRYLCDPGRPRSAAARALIHLQGCLVSAARTMQFVERLRRHPDARGAVEKVDFTIALRIIEDLRGLRNAIEHMYEDVENKTEGDMLPWFNEDATMFRLSVKENGGYREVQTETAKLAALLRAMADIARGVARWSPDREEGQPSEAR